jgi:hypothetical protein
MRFVLICLSLISAPILVCAQNTRVSSLNSVFQEVIVRVDTMSFTYSQNQINYQGEPHLAFRYLNEEQVVELQLYPSNKTYFDTHRLSVKKSMDFDVMDSIVFVNDSYFKFRVRFKSISKSDFQHLMFAIEGVDKSQNVELKLLPYTFTKATFYPGSDELYIGEEKRFEVVTNNIANLKIDGEWKKQDNVEYRLTERNGMVFITILPNTIGNIAFDIIFETYKPFIDGKERISYTLEKQTFNFSVKGSRLAFLKIDQREVIKERDNVEGVEIQIDNHRFLQINKTYRIEDREENGGPLMAELYTVRRLSNDKILCLLRPYLYHRVTEGYLFIKDGDKAQFITNINILPEAKIYKLSILRQGKNWSSDAYIMPGEKVEIRLEGEGFSKARFYFEDLEDVSLDTITRNDKVASFIFKVPINLRKRAIDIYNYDKKTGVSLAVKEFERPRPLDFVSINYGEGPKMVNGLNHPILYKHTVRDIVLSFDPSKIDRGDQLYGKQILEVEVRITGSKEELVEMQKIDYIEICPDESSPRSAFYLSNTCNRQDILLNTILSRKTHSLDEWSKITLTIRHKKDRYNGEGYTQRIEILLQKLITFDVEVSFPAGLVIKKVGVDGFPGLGGISLAMLAQFSFYDKEQIKKLKPYKLGAGFLAQNAFNFSPTATDRDLGLVVLASVYPTKKDKKLSFPLYGGFGYFLNQAKFFYLVGPGIRVNF